MPYKYSICHPERPNIEYPDKVLSEKDVKDIVHNYDWDGELLKMKTIKDDKLYYSPSLDFTNLENDFSFCLSSLSNQKELTFYVFYNRLIMKKILFGLLGEKETFSVIEKEFSKDDAYELLDLFLRKNYKSMERKLTGE